MAAGRGWLVAARSAGLLAGVPGSPLCGLSSWLLGRPPSMAAGLEEAGSRKAWAWQSQNVVSAAFFGSEPVPGAGGIQGPGN